MNTSAALHGQRPRLCFSSTPTLVVKVGTTSLVRPDGMVDRDAQAVLCAQLAALRRHGAQPVLVSSGAVAAGLPVLGFKHRPDDIETLQALSAVGQGVLMETYRPLLAACGVHCGQVLLTRTNFEERSQYLRARATLRRMLELNVLPIVNENDTVAGDEIRFGDNDRLSALVAHLIQADALVLLTDQAGLFDADPRLVTSANLIEEVHAIDEELEAMASGVSSGLGSGGMASKLAAAKMASHSGVPTVIASGRDPDVLLSLLHGAPIGTLVRPQPRRLSSRKLWIAFAQPPAGRLVIDKGAVRALVENGRSLLAVGIAAVRGKFIAGDAVEILDGKENLVAKGRVRVDAETVRSAAGNRGAPVIVHRDDLVVLR